MQLNPTRLPDDFQFSQSSLQDFVDCARRFQLRYIQQLAWPALETEPVLENERFLEQGSRFHRLIHQHLLGIPVNRLEVGIQDVDLARWWQNYLDSAAETIGFEGLHSSQHLYPEISLSGPLGKYRLMAKYDLVVKHPHGSWFIVDWKTSRKCPQSHWLRERLQSYVYPYLLAQAGEGLNDGDTIQPQSLEMVYWFSDFPEEAERIRYGQAKYEADKAYLEGLVSRIASLDETGFAMTEREIRCKYCVYRSLCERGVQAGQLDGYSDAGEYMDNDDFDLDIDQVAEIEF